MIWLICCFDAIMEISLPNQFESEVIWQNWSEKEKVHLMHLWPHFNGQCGLVLTNDTNEWILLLWPKLRLFITLIWSFSFDKGTNTISVWIKYTLKSEILSDLEENFLIKVNNKVNHDSTICNIQYLARHIWWCIMTFGAVINVVKQSGPGYI